MNYEDLDAKLLLSLVPEQEHEIQDILDFWGEEAPTPYNLYPDVLNSYVTKLLKENREIALLNRIFDFYEELALSSDQRVVDFLQVGLLEYLWDEKESFLRLQQYMRPKTREVNKDIHRYLNVPKK